WRTGSLPVCSPFPSLPPFGLFLSPLILSHPGTDVHLLKVAHNGIGQRRMRKEEAATHGGGCVDLLHCAMHEEGGGSGFPIRAHTSPKFSLRMKLIMKDLSDKNIDIHNLNLQDDIHNSVPSLFFCIVKNHYLALPTPSSECAVML
uniref:Uncharacterized protein n=1 Tax=Oryza glaberrima TaxID=4538 RepID=I1QTJ3_ORYGL